MIIKDMDDSSHIILASNSPRRKELLGFTGIPFRVVPTGSEPAMEEGEAPEDFVKRSALSKAAVVSLAHPHLWVVGADTVVMCEGYVMGKPSGPDEAALMLTRLSGKTHAVHTGVSLVHSALAVKRVEVETTLVTFSPLTEEEIRAYVATGEPLDKAGGYGAQGMGAVFLEKIEGSYTNVVGLPLTRLIRMLVEEGVAVPAPGGGGIYGLKRKAEIPLKGG